MMIFDEPFINDILAPISMQTAGKPPFYVLWKSRLKYLILKLDQNWTTIKFANKYLFTLNASKNEIQIQITIA